MTDVVQPKLFFESNLIFYLKEPDNELNNSNYPRIQR